MPITFGGQPCVDPKELFDLCLAQRLPMDAWFRKANSFRSERGPNPGTGTLLLSRASLNALGDLNAVKTLVFDDSRNKVTLQKISVTNCTCVTPGVRSDKYAAYAVSIADRRIQLKLVPAGTNYNVRDSSGTGYQTNSLNAGVAWTWQQMVDELTGFLGIGSLTLPYAPDGVPENYEFWNAYAWDSLNLIVGRLGCAVSYNAFTDTFAIVEVGATDAAHVQAVADIDKFRVWDTDPLALPAATLPASVNVVYPIFPPPTDGSTPYDLTTVSLATTSPYTGTIVYIHGDLGSPVTAGQNFATRAAERAAKFYQAYSDGVINPLQRVYAGVQTSAGLFPGKRVKGIAWYDFGSAEGGLKTEVYRGGGFDLETFASIIPAAAGGGDKLCRVAHAAVASGAINYWPCTFRSLTVATDTFANGPVGPAIYDLFLVQDKGYALTWPAGPDGPGCYDGIVQVGTKTLNVDGSPYTLPVYVTMEAPFLGPDCQVRN